MSGHWRVESHPVLGPLPPAPPVSFTFAGRTITARSGETIGAALLAAGIRVLRRTEVSGAPRGMYCVIGHCFECRVRVNGQEGVRACLTPVQEGMAVEPGGAQHGPPPRDPAPPEAHHER